MITCAITDRHRLRGKTLLENIAEVLLAEPSWIQIREKDLPARELYELLQAVRNLSNPHKTKFILNSRIEVALAAGADGAHFPSLWPAPRIWRSIVPDGFLIGVSCHSVDEVIAAEAEGADYVLFGPVFTPLSKSSVLAPHGIDGLKEATASVQIPVLALGGITRENAAACVDAGAAGVAGISLFSTLASPARI